MRCELCGYESDEISDSIGVCVNCLRENPQKALKKGMQSHFEWRRLVNLPVFPPHEGGITCRICVNQCEIPENGSGYCGIIRNEGGRITTITGGFDKAYLHWYFDPHPTNCVAEPVCPEREHRGFHNLAVFFAGCNLDCLFCQNIHHKYMIKDGQVDSREGMVIHFDELANVAMESRVSCICYFGGDPAPHSVYALRVSREVLKRSKEKGENRRICWETNGLENPGVMKEMAELSLESGGIVKIDWKAYTPSIYQVLTGVDGEKALTRIKKNIRLLVEMDVRSSPPLLVVSTLIVPHYVDGLEVYNMARYMAALNPEIPYVLLAFAPQHLMYDVPTTSRKQMDEVYRAARDAGLKQVYVGNIWLLR